MRLHPANRWVKLMFFSPRAAEAEGKSAKLKMNLDMRLNLARIFFRLALRLRLVDTAAVEYWADSVIAAEPVVRFPFTDLARASHIPSTTVDELLGEVTGHRELHHPGRIGLALLRRRLRDGTLAPDTAIKFALEIGATGPLTDRERYKADRLDDSVWLAASGTYGTRRGRAPRDYRVLGEVCRV